ncbi:MAG: xanthine dehydrogenase family protein subunit M [Chloroflexi bacterium]|nr:xanthine dehydrogenase family protein subunit M [Chloroflexota bacterium]
MQAIEYASPASIADAVRLLQRGGPTARVLAGGTDIIVMAREYRRDTSMMVDVKKIPETTELSYSPDTGLHLGAAVPCYRIYEDAEIGRLYPALIDSASLIGGIQIQSRASIGGNLCNSSPAADSIPTLIALGATCHIAGPNGERTVKTEDFCVAPGRNVLQPGEFLVWLEIPAPAPRSGAKFLRFIPRNEMDIAVVNVAAAVTLDESRRRIASARISIGAVAPTPLFVQEAGAALAGVAATPDAWQPAIDAAQAAARPITDMRGSAAQRRHLVGVLTRRALEGAVERARDI